ncbi:shikimate dehydrogenase [Synechococcus elongatus IITB4]|uniref:shikimate dehydrogenase n=1 Tax=Synechococcus elongatus TaxID=32046 RepID=UPI0030D23D76
MAALTGRTRLLGIIGDPIEHSLSPLIQNAAIAELGLDYCYVPFPVQGADLATALAGLAVVGVQGFNVTIPHKQAVMPLLSEVSELAQSVGSVNTVWRTAEGWAGTNTDVLGFLAPLQALRSDWSGCRVVLLGCGGAARAVVAGCLQLGCRAIATVVRDSRKGSAFQQSWGDRAAALSIHDWSEIPDLLASADLVVNTTPLGMDPHIERSPLDDPAAQQLRSDTIAYDLIYTPSPTRFLQQAIAQGCQAIDGLEMLVQQGAAGLKIWTGAESVPVDTMRSVLKAHLGLA